MTQPGSDNFTRPCKAAVCPPTAGKTCIPRPSTTGIKGVRRRRETIRLQTIFVVGQPQK